MDLCRLALSAGCGFVARSFSGDNKQLTKLLKLALQYEGLAFIDVISPCVAYGNEKDFSHSFSFMKERKWPLHEIDIIFETQTKEEDIPEGEIKKIPLPNGAFLILKKLSKHDPTKKEQAEQVLEQALTNNQIATGLIYYQEKENFLEQMALSEEALVDMEKIQPEPQTLSSILENYR